MQNLNIKFTISADYLLTPPTVTLLVGDCICTRILLNEDYHAVIDMDMDPVLTSELTIQVIYDTKHPDDPYTEITISNIEINGVKSPRFMLQSTYTPDYPVEWYKQQIEAKNPPKTVHTGVETLGWNGVWELNVGLPAFLWIHKIHNHGWIYK